MTCRHAPGDPNCSSSPAGQARILRSEREWSRKERDSLKDEIAALKRKMGALTPDKSKYEILEAVEIQNKSRPGSWSTYMVMKVKYPSCEKCSYEGVKVTVFRDVTMKDVIFWNEIDPHFADPEESRLKTQAPAPVCRFPASDDGWRDALSYANRKTGHDVTE